MGSVKCVKTAKYGYITISLILCVMGILLIALPDISSNVIYYSLGTIIIAYGMIRLVGYFSRDLYQLAFQFDLAFGMLLMILGVVMILKKSETVQMFYVIFGILILADGLFKIQIAIDARSFGLKNWFFILLLGIISGIFGTFLVIRPVRNAEAELIFLGLALLFEGFMSLGVAIMAVKIADYQKFDTER